MESFAESAVGANPETLATFHAKRVEFSTQLTKLEGKVNDVKLKLLDSFEDDTIKTSLTSLLGIDVSKNKVIRSTKNTRSDKLDLKALKGYYEQCNPDQKALINEYLFWTSLQVPIRHNREHHKHELGANIAKMFNKGLGYATLGGSATVTDSIEMAVGVAANRWMARYVGKKGKSQAKFLYATEQSQNLFFAAAETVGDHNEAEGLALMAKALCPKTGGTIEKSPIFKELEKIFGTEKAKLILLSEFPIAQIEDNPVVVDKYN